MDLKNLKNKSWFPYTVAACSAVFLSFLLQNIAALGRFFLLIWQMICPLVVGAVFAYMMDPIARFIEKNLVFRLKRKTIGRNISVILTCIIVYGGVFVLFISIMPSLLKSIKILINNIDRYEKMIILFLQSHGMDNGKVQQNVSSLSDKVKEAIPVITKNVLETTTHMSGTIGNIGIGCVLAIYFLLYKKRIVPWVIGICRKLVKRDKYNEFADFCKRCNTILLKYISCTLLDALIIGVSNALIMVVFHMPFVALVSVIVGITNILPTIGPVIGCVVGFIILVFVSPGYALVFLIIALIIQTIDGYVLKPKLFGNSLGVSSIWILIAIICGGKMFGFVGVLVAIPFAAIAQYILEEFLFPKVKEERKAVFRDSK